LIGLLLFKRFRIHLGLDEVRITAEQPVAAIADPSSSPSSSGS
jgi:hypothetical protein